MKREVIFDALAVEAPELLAGEIEVDVAIIANARSDTLIPINRDKIRPTRSTIARHPVTIP